MSLKPDLLVVGCDPVGFDIAFAASGLGANVVVVGQDHPPDSKQRARLAAVGVTVLDGRGRFQDARHFLFNDQRWMPRRFVIANGADRPDPGIKASHGSVTLVLGDGPDACQAAMHAAEAGERVILACPGPFLPGFNREHVEWLRLLASSRRMSILEGCGIPAPPTGGEDRIRLGDRQTVAASELGNVINGLPWQPRLSGLDLENAVRGVATPDRSLRLGHARLYLVGEALASLGAMPPPRNQIGIVLAEALYGKRTHRPEAFDLRHVATRPGIAEFGLTPDRFPETRRNAYRILRAVRHRDQLLQSAALLVVTDLNSRVVGASAYGPNAAELLVPLQLLARNRTPITALAELALSAQGDDDLLAQIARQPLVQKLKSPGARWLMRWRRLFG